MFGFKKDEKKEESKEKKEAPQPKAVNRFAALEGSGNDNSAKKKDKTVNKKEDKEELPMEIPPAPKPASAVPKPPTVPSLFNPTNTPAPSAPSTPSAFDKSAQNGAANSIPNPFASKQTVGFGAALGEKKTSLQTSPGFSFGQASGSAPPSGDNTPSKGGLAFTFGSASSLPSFPKPAEMDKAPLTPPKFSFGGADQSDKKEEVKDEKDEKDEKNEESNGSESVRTNTVTGEEDEDDLYEIKARLYKFVDGWKPSGSGLFKIKQNRETKKKRVLHRDATTTKILLVSVNFFMASR